MRRPNAFTKRKSSPPIQIPTKTEKTMTIAVDWSVAFRVGQVTCFSSSRTSPMNPMGKSTSCPIAAKIGMRGILSQDVDARQMELLCTQHEVRSDSNAGKAAYKKDDGIFHTSRSWKGCWMCSDGCHRRFCGF